VTKIGKKYYERFAPVHLFQKLVKNIMRGLLQASLPSAHSTGASVKSVGRKKVKNLIVWNIWRVVAAIS
jgi:hypothetical protein